MLMLNSQTKNLKNLFVSPTTAKIAKRYETLETQEENRAFKTLNALMVAAVTTARVQRAVWCSCWRHVLEDSSLGSCSEMM
jgi:hypothetical protein